MIAIACAAVACLAAYLVSHREPKHRPIAEALACGLSYAICNALNAHIEVNGTAISGRLLLALWACVALMSGWAYQRAWSWRPIEGIALFGTIAAIVAPALITGEPHWWTLATWGPFVVSSLAGVIALWRWHDDRGLPRYWSPSGERVKEPSRWTITHRTALLLLASDVCMLLFVAWPSVSEWQGRCSALVVTVVQIVWLWRERSKEERKLVTDLLRRHGPLPGLRLTELSAGRLRRGTIYVLLNLMEQEGLISSMPLANGSGIRIYKCV